ncbi:MAG: DUF3616 domain-containing protein [Spirulina sp. SIO3F2]|nr:DUF3616 domain-containing protein [Spirulina sp. SIO3F2]
MSNAFLLSRVRLQFNQSNPDLLHQLSAIALSPDGSLWVGSDEFLSLERLSPLGSNLYGDHQTFHLGDYLELADSEAEIDIEGLSYSAGYLWVTGSYSAKRKKPKGKKTGANAHKDIQRLTKIKQDANRYLLARIPVHEGNLVQSCNKTKDHPRLTAACLGKSPSQNVLLDCLKQDEHLGPFLKVGLPSKDNGFDIEGLAVQGQRVLLGLRGPVLGGWAIILELELTEGEPGELCFKEFDKNVFYRKHFVDLNGLGIRDLFLHQNELFILAGPTMLLPGTLQIFRLRDLLQHRQDTLWPQATSELEWLFDLPYNPGQDNAEGLTLFPCLGYEDSLMVVYDAPDLARCPDGRSIFTDVFRLPS